jgi:hypothetical protein
MKTNQFTWFALIDDPKDNTIYPEILSVSLAVAECGLCDDLAATDISLQKNTNNRVKRKIQHNNRRTKQNIK